MTEPRELERERIRKALQDLTTCGISIYKVSVILDQPYNTVKHWSQTGSVESFYAQAIERLYRQHCSYLNVCQISPQNVYCEISHITTCTSP